MKIAGFAISLLMCATPALAQQATLHDALLDHLAGKWVLTGSIAGHPITHDVSASWVLNHQYIEFKEVSRTKNKDGDPDYIATVYIGWYEPKKEYACVWLDDYGGMSSQSIGHAPRADNALAFAFQDSNDPGIFRTTFTYDAAAGNWTMNMDQDTNGKLSPFARTTLASAK